MQHKNILIISLLALLIAMPTSAQTLSEEAIVSLMSCSPAEPLYFHYGHSAIRIQDPHYVGPDGREGAIDWTFNYGVFDFRQTGFYAKFVKGQTDYMLGMEHTAEFQMSSSYAGRQVYYQPLLLTQEQKQAIMDALAENYLPQNRYYRYNFVYDNCATRPWRIIRKTLELPQAEGMAGQTWRENIDYFSGKWTWGKFGINLAFGYEADREMTREQSLFLPENLMNYISEQGLSEDEYIAPFEPRDGNFWTSPELVILLLFLLIIGFTVLDIWRKKQTWLLDGCLFGIYFAVGCILFYLYFFSEHPFVGSNLNILYLNPLWILPLILCFVKKGQQWLIQSSPFLLGWLVVAMMWILLRHQSLHLMLTLVFLHTCRLVYIRKKK